MTQRSWHRSLVLGLLLLAGAMPLAAQAPTCGLPVDTALATRGKSLYTGRACAGCHSIGQGKRVGPDLKGVTALRDLAWLRRWLKNPTAMLTSDSLAKALLAQYNNVPMPTPRLADDEVEAILHYMARESGKACVK